MSFPEGVCVAVTSLRPLYSDLEHFLSDSSNVLVCRRGRVPIVNKKTGEKKTFTWRDSPWCNPYKLDEYSLEESLRLYKEHLDETLKEEMTRNQFLLLAQKKRIGCFCAPGNKCHRDVIIEKLKELCSDTENHIKN